MEKNLEKYICMHIYVFVYVNIYVCIYMYTESLCTTFVLKLTQYCKLTILQ